MNSVKVYVGTYGKYSSGSISGKWLDLEDYSDKDEFFEACRDLHKDERDHEFMFQDFEGVPQGMITESSIDDDLWEFLSMEEHEQEIIFAYYDDSIMRCPICGRLYYYDYHYQYFANTQNDEEETLTRIDLQQAIDKASVKIKSYKFKTITKIDVFMLIDY